MFSLNNKYANITFTFIIGVYPLEITIHTVTVCWNYITSNNCLKSIDIPL